ncbi:MAG: hypothetical protein HC848_02540 [Limnobacter sp.]|nr:hypothetical protein [Limnobacter sp.]
MSGFAVSPSSPGVFSQDITECSNSQTAQLQAGQGAGLVSAARIAVQTTADALVRALPPGLSASSAFFLASLHGRVVNCVDDPRASLAALVLSVSKFTVLGALPA